MASNVINHVYAMSLQMGYGKFLGWKTHASAKKEVHFNFTTEAPMLRILQDFYVFINPVV
jgi:hypothetical protein